MEYDALPVEKRSEYLQNNGLHEKHLGAWRKKIAVALSPSLQKQDGTELTCSIAALLNQGTFFLKNSYTARTPYNYIFLIGKILAELA